MNLREAGATVVENFKDILEAMEGAVAIINNQGATFHAAADRILAMKAWCIQLQASAKVFNGILEKMKADTHDHQRYALGLQSHTKTLLVSLQAWEKYYKPDEIHDRKENTRLKNHLKELIQAWVVEYLPSMFNACGGMGIEREKVLFIETKIIDFARKLKVRVTLRLTDIHDYR